MRQAAMRELHPRREGCDLLRELPGRSAAGRAADAAPPAAGFVPSASAPIVPSSGPNPAVAGILAGFFPFGVGAVYCGQYAKGLAHLVIFTLLVWGESVIDNDGVNTILGLGIAFFYVWQIIDSVRTAKAIQMGQPPPDPFGLAQAFGARTGATGTADAAGAGNGRNPVPPRFPRPLWF